MKKFLPILLISIFYFLFSTLLPSPTLAAEDCSLFDSITGKNPSGKFICEVSECLGGMDAPTCTSIVNLFSSKQADGPWYNQNPTQFAKKIKDAPADEIFGERYTFAQINWIINSLATMLNPASGIDSPTKLFEFINAVKGVIGQVQNGQQPSLADYAKLGPAGLFAGGVSALYSNPPASGISEAKYLASKIFDLGSGVTPVNAQGYGFTGLGGQTGTNSAVKALWTASRNMAYLIMVILLVASGFLIMFRVKINPQTVVSLQTMIPKLIITMLLVTFSFAIAGLVIDLIYVFIAGFVGLLSLNRDIVTGSVSGLINETTNRSFITYMWYQAPLSIVGIIIGIIIAGIGIFGSLSGPLAWTAVLAGIIAICISVVFIITLIKIWWMLLKTYTLLILQIIIGPLQIMLDLIPGQQGFGSWIRNIIANASVFATIPIMFIIQHIISGNFITNSILGLNTASGLGGINLHLPYMGPGLSPLLFWAVGFVIFTLTPKIADMIRDALKIPAFKYGAAVGESVAMYKPVYGVAQQAVISAGARGAIDVAREKGPKQIQRLVEFAEAGLISTKVIQPKQRPPI